jgi:hypothetical protein
MQEGRPEDTRIGPEVPILIAQTPVAAAAGAPDVNRSSRLQQLWINLDSAQRRSAPFLAGVRAALALEPGASDVNDFARNELVKVLGDVGLAKKTRCR